MTVTVDGQPATQDGTVVLVQTQRARIDVAQRDERAYVARLLRPSTGPALQLSPDDPLIIVGFAPSAAKSSN